MVFNNKNSVFFCLQECQRLKQQVLSLRRENSTLDTEVHEKERTVSQLQMRVAVLEQECKDKDQLMRRTKEVLEATQQQKVGFVWAQARMLIKILLKIVPNKYNVIT